jgi:two-component system, NtrC family, nitrogen regulation sensor histidine kinase NtrY
MNRNFSFRIGALIFLLAASSVLTGYLIAAKGSVGLTVFSAIAAVFFAINLVTYINLTNKRISFFFDAVRNDDSNLSFPTGSGNRSLRELYRSMTRVNDQIKQLKIENRQQEQYFSILIEHLATGIVIFDSKGFIEHANSAARRLLSTDVLTHLKQIERKDRKLFQAINDIKPSQNRLVSLQTEQGELQLSLKATIFTKGDESLTILSLNDIRNELDEKELDSWIRLIRVLMHEIMNSITPITSLSDSLTAILKKEDRILMPTEVDEKLISTVVQGLSVIKEQGKGLTSFVDSYRKLTRVPEPVKKNFRIADLLTRIKILYRSLDNSSTAEFITELKYPDQEVFADENLISQVLINLLKNAIEANTGNPSARIALVSDLSEDDHVLLRVLDNGPGIQPENLDKIFIPFFTTRQDGSGIGLSISRQIMRIHGGSLRVKSIPGAETEFCITV